MIAVVQVFRRDVTQRVDVAAVVERRVVERVDNVHMRDLVRVRNRMAERLSEQYDEVRALPLPKEAR